MTDAQPDPPEDEVPSPRLAQFQEEVAKLKVTGGGANPERLGAQWGIALTIIGIVIMVIAYFSARQDTLQEYILRDTIAALGGFAVAIIGIVIWIRNSLTRYLRYWIIRLVYEQREQTDQIVEALKNK